MGGKGEKTISDGGGWMWGSSWAQAMGAEEDWELGKAYGTMIHTLRRDTTLEGSVRERGSVTARQRLLGGNACRERERGSVIASQRVSEIP